MNNQRLFALFLALVLSSLALHAADFKVVSAPNPADKNVFKGFSLYCHDGFKAVVDRPEIDGVRVLKCTLTKAVSPSPGAQRVQLRLVVPQGQIQALTEYRLRFRCRTDRPAVFTFRCQASVSPFETVTEHSAGVAVCTTKWQYVEHCFTPYLSNDSVAFWMPNFELGWLGQDNAVYLADVVLEALD